MKRHSCPTCGFIHQQPKSYSAFVSLMTMVFVGVVVTKAALATDGLVSALCWTTVGLYVFSILITLGGLSMAASNALRDEARR